MLDDDNDWNFKPIERPLCEQKPSKGGAEPAKESTGECHKAGDVPAFMAREPFYDMGNLVLPSETMGQLQALKARFERHSLVYDQWGLSKTDPCGRHIAFNLYGPPGTGKTMCVEAVTRLFGKRLIDVSYAEIESKYVGDTGKNIVAAFDAAKRQNAVLFFDEADSILGQRMSSVTQAADQAVNVSRAVMLKQLDAFDGIVAFATNFAKNFDSAFVRRISFHIEIPLPDRDGRRLIAEKLVPVDVPFKDKIDFARIADLAEGMSGGDLKNIIVNAICSLAAVDWGHMGEDAITDEFVKQIEYTRKAKENVGHAAVVVSQEEIGGLM